MFFIISMRLIKTRSLITKKEESFKLKHWGKKWLCTVCNLMGGGKKAFKKHCSATAVRFNLGYWFKKKKDRRKYYTWENRETSFDLSSISCVSALTRGMTCFLHVKASSCSCSRRYQTPPPPTQPSPNCNRGICEHILQQAQKQVLIFHRRIVAFKPDFELEDAAAATAAPRRQKVLRWPVLKSCFVSIPHH